MRRLDLPPRAVVILAAALATAAVAAFSTGGVEAAGNKYASSSARATTTSSSWGSYAGGAMHGAEVALAAAATVEDEVAPEFPVGLVVGDGHGSSFDGLTRGQPFCPPHKTCAANGGMPYTPGCLTIYQCKNGRG